MKQKKWSVHVLIMMIKEQKLIEQIQRSKFDSKIS